MLRRVKETKRRARGRVKRALGNLPPHLAGTSASLFLSLTSLTFNRWGQFAGRETPRWQEMKPPQLLSTHLPHSASLLLLSIPCSILLSPVSQHIKGLEEKHGDSLGRLFASPLFILYPVLTPASSHSWVSCATCLSEGAKGRLNLRDTIVLWCSGVTRNSGIDQDEALILHDHSEARLSFFFCCAFSRFLKFTLHCLSLWLTVSCKSTWNCRDFMLRRKVQ